MHVRVIWRIMDVLDCFSITAHHDVPTKDDHVCFTSLFNEVSPIRPSLLKFGAP